MSRTTLESVRCHAEGCGMFLGIITSDGAGPRPPSREECPTPGCPMRLKLRRFAKPGDGMRGVRGPDKVKSEALEMLGE